MLQLRSETDHLFPSHITLNDAFTKSKIHSIKFCLPDGLFFKLRVQIIAIRKTMIAVITNIMMLAKLKTRSNQTHSNSRAGFVIHVLTSFVLKILTL